MEKKSSAYYQRLYRQRLREQGLVKKEVWILPEHASALMAVERKLRQPMAQLDAMEKEIDMSMQQVWSATALHKALSGTELFQGKRASVELIDGSEASLHVTMHEYGDLPLFIAVFGEQIIVEALLWPVSDVRDLAKFNEEVLRTHKLFPLSSIGLERLADGTDCYTMFGALSSSSALSDVVFEIELLADNVIKATEAYENHLAMPA
ncbi:YjfI family protein [Pseudomonas abyssi]|jgi:uncharacterized protein YjfI (DUF2170 family)|uniref:biofilm formation regulator BacA n=1 Tax=Pseudomonas abyssi TaxID=170540 RepID=UPI003C7B27B4